jgi:hypothetical protein
MLFVESKYATSFRRNNGLTLNPLNLRPRGGTGFARFASFAEGVHEWKARITDPDYAYAKTISLTDLIQVYAPPSENDSGGYVRQVGDLLSAWPREDATMTPVNYSSLPFPVQVRIIPAAQTNQRPGMKMTPAYITWHETANTSAGAGARMHADWLHNGASGGADKQVSFHFVVDDREAFQLLPLDEVAWHAGDGYNGPGNRSSIAIECCVNKDGNLRRAQDNMARLIALLTSSFGMPVSSVVQHNKWSGKNCPTLLRSEPGGWDRVIKLISGYASATAPTQPALTLPAGMDLALAERMFGSLNAGGKVWSFSPVGPVSRLWLTLGRFPRIADYLAGADGSQRWIFADGTIIWKPSEGSDVRVLR